MDDQRFFSAETPILIVEDNPQYAKVLEKMLRGSLGFVKISHVPSTQEAFDFLKANPQSVKILFVDFRFPGDETGAKLLARLQEAQLLKGKVAFIVTSDPSAESVRAAADVGAIGVIAKPFDTDQIRSQLDRARRAVLADEKDYF